MQKPKSPIANDSLELMLDAICNVFGGILLLAILVILQTQVTVEDLRSQKDLEIDLQRMEMENEKTAEEVQTLHNQKAILESSYRQTHFEDKKQIFNRQEEWLSESQKWILVHKEAQEKLHRTRQLLSEYEMNILAVTAQIEKAEAKNASLQKQAIEVEDTTTKSIRLPRLRAASAHPVYFIVQAPMVYALGDADRSAETSYISKDCRVTPMGSYWGRRAKIEPIKGKGIPIPKSPAEDGNFSAQLKAYKPENFCIYFFVCGDNASFAGFECLKKIVLNQRYSYGVSAYLPETGLIAHYGMPSTQ